MIDMPDVTIVASCRDATARSLALTRAKSSMLSSLERYLCRDVDDDEPALLELLGDGLLGVGLDLALGLDAGEVHRLEDIRGHGLCRHLVVAAATGAADQSAELLDGVCTRLGDLAIDLAGAHELGERGVHCLHAV